MLLQKVHEPSRYCLPLPTLSLRLRLFNTLGKLVLDKFLIQERFLVWPSSRILCIPLRHIIGQNYICVSKAIGSKPPARKAPAPASATVASVYEHPSSSASPKTKHVMPATAPSDRGFAFIQEGCWTGGYGNFYVGTRSVCRKHDKRTPRRRESEKYIGFFFLK